MGYFAGHIASGLFAAVWSEVWKFGAGTGLIILLLAAAYFSPFSKQWFVVGAVVVAAIMFVYGYGIRDEKTVCTDKVKYVYVRSHTPSQAKKYLAPPVHTPHTCGELEWGCQP